MPDLALFLNPFHYAALALVLVVQWQIGRQFYQYAAARLGRRAARPLMAGYAAVFLFGVAAGFPQLAPYFRLPRLALFIIGGTTHLWMYTSTAAWLIHAAFRAFAYRAGKPRFSPARRHLLNAATGAAMAAPFAVIAYGALIERTGFRVREVDVPVPGLAPDLDGLRLLQLSDIHLSIFLSEHELARVIGQANEVKAHLALVTGDLITGRGDPLDACLRQVSRLRADAGIFGCLGNHEGYAHAEDYATREGARLGIRFLRQQHERLRFGSAVLNLCGVDYQPIGRPAAYLRGAERMIVPGSLNLLLCHNPDVFPVAAGKGYDVMVSGHTHGGQVTVEILDQSINPARFITPYVYGLYRKEKAAAYVTRGIGTIGIPARIGAPPEIAVLRLRKA